MKGTVKQIKTKQLDNGGTLYSVNIDGTWYSTFDEKAAEIDGKQIEYSYKTVEKNGKEFKNLTAFEIVQNNSTTGSNGSQSNGKSDCWINAVALIKSGLEGGIIKDMTEARQEFMSTYIFLCHVWQGNKEKAEQYTNGKPAIEEFEGKEVSADDVPF